MGLINNDSFEAKNGVQKTGTYISFNGEVLHLQKQNEMYQLVAYYRVYWDKAARDAGKMHIDSGTLIVEIPDTDLNTNLYTILYNDLKTKFTNTTDEL
jgi:hypothetical protein